uniref:Uncharacterized protein n=1 Tax=Avena sativa TaxID=4498 RepID=A0ACD5X8M4_AVESA
MESKLRRRSRGRALIRSSALAAALSAIWRIDLRFTPHLDAAAAAAGPRPRPSPTVEYSLANAGSLDSDAAALTEFCVAADRSGALATRNGSASPSPCGTPAWRGVTSGGGRVTRLVLEGLGLSGPDALGHLASLDALRVLSLKGNALSGAVPDLSPLLGLKLLFLSRNKLSGAIPPSLGALYRLYRLDLSSNDLSGAVPPQLSRLDRLLTLRLDSNRLTGALDGIALPRLQDLNVSNNLLSGKIPVAMSGFPAASFVGNPGLCGAPLPPCTDTWQGQDESRRRGGDCGRGLRGGRARGRPPLLLLLDAPSERRHREGEKIVYSSSPFELGKIVFLEEPGGGGRRFKLEELLRASIEMLGKGGCGTAYKAVLDDSNVLAVKRLRDAAAPGPASAASKKEFEHHMAHGNIKSTNILLDRSGEARLADCGLAQLSGSSSSSAGYRAPKAPPSRPWASQKGDVYAFGVVLLELLTGRCPGGGDGAAEPELPRWVQSVVREEWTSEVFDLELMKDRGIEEEMVAMLQLALSCAAAEPGQRPKVGHVVRMVDEVRTASCCGGGESSPSRESSMTSGPNVQLSSSSSVAIFVD